MVALLRRDGVLGQVLIHGGGLTVRRRIVALGQGLRGNEEGVIQSWRAQRHWQPARTGEHASAARAISGLRSWAMAAVAASPRASLTAARMRAFVTRPR